MALFAQLGGGIYTKAADVGSDLVGKVEAGIPEDDPRNAGVIADLVGDNVGDCAGRGADLFESTAAENIGAMILGVAVFAIAETPAGRIPRPGSSSRSWSAPSACSPPSSAMFFIRGSETENPMNILNRGYWVTTILSVVGLAFVTIVMMDTGGTHRRNGLPVWVWFFVAGIVGLATSVVVRVHHPVLHRRLATGRCARSPRRRRPGPRRTSSRGIAVGFETTFVTAITIGIALLASHWLGSQAEPVNAEGHDVGGIFGTAVATMGMLMTTAYILAMDTFGPITDNAGGIAEFSRAEAGAREITDRLDAVGNTTKALTKGYAIARQPRRVPAVQRLHRQGQPDPDQPRRRPLSTAVNLAEVDVFVAALIGAMLVYFFSASPSARSARQPRRSSSRCAASSARCPGSWTTPSARLRARRRHHHPRGAARRWSRPGCWPSPRRSSSALLLGYQAVAGLLMVGTIAGVMLATVLNNGGGAWDNAKKYIESGNLKDDDGNVLGKGTARTPPRSSATPSAIRSRTPPARRCTCWSSCWPRSPWCWRRCSSARARPLELARVPWISSSRRSLIGIIQGLTEFIPVSSSAHLELAPWIFGWATSSLIGSLAFDVFLHLGTLIALLVYFWRDWVRLVGAVLASIRDRHIGLDADRRLGWFLMLGHHPGRHHRLRRRGLHRPGPARRQR